MTVALTLIILAVLEGGQAWAWDSPQSITAFGVGGVLLAAFVMAETRAVEPILPLWVFSRRLLLTTTLVGLGVGAILIGLTSYVPTYLEGSVDAPPLVAGLALGALTLGWPLAAGYRTPLPAHRLQEHRPDWRWPRGARHPHPRRIPAATPSVAIVAISCFVVGLGMGLVVLPTLIAAQVSVPRKKRGVVTGTNMFARSVGSAIGVAIFGAVANGIFAASGGSVTDPAAVRAASTSVFIGVAVFALMVVLAAIAMPAKSAEASPIAGREPEASRS